MSRSYKRVGGFNCTSAGIKKPYLKWMNKRIRRDICFFIPDGNSYRRFVCIWDYRDYDFRYFSKREVESSWYFREGKQYKIFIK